MASEWNSLDVAQLVVAALMPLTLLGLGLIVARNNRRLDSFQHANQTVVARRHEIFKAVASKLNQLLCFLAFVGRWKEITPADVLNLKRDVDEVMYTNRLLFSDTLFVTYQAFMARLFAMYATIDGDALIRARISFDLGDRRNLPWWSASMVNMFAQDHICEPAEAQLAYDELSAAFRADLYVTELTRPLALIVRKRETEYASSTHSSRAIRISHASRAAFVRWQQSRRAKSSCISGAATASVPMTKERLCGCTRRSSRGSKASASTRRSAAPARTPPA